MSDEMILMALVIGFFIAAALWFNANDKLEPEKSHTTRNVVLLILIVIAGKCFYDYKAGHIAAAALCDDDEISEFTSNIVTLMVYNKHGLMGSTGYLMKIEECFPELEEARKDRL